MTEVEDRTGPSGGSPALGTARCPGPGFQDYLDGDTRDVPVILRRQDYEYRGSTDLSVDRYISPEWHQREVEKLWRKVWQMACREEEVARVGDVHVYDIADDSIIIVRTGTGELKAFYNVCLHRGRKLCDASGHRDELRCGFHGFTWSLDGTLGTVPCAWDFGHVDPDAFSLPEVRVGTWGGFVFVCMSPETEPLESFLGPLAEHFADFPLEDRYTSMHTSKIVPGNWKVACEAFIESYHVAGTHPQGLMFVGDANTQYDNFGERYNFNRMLVPHAVPSPHLGPDVTDDDVVDVIKALGRGGQAVRADLDAGISPRQALAASQRRALERSTGVNLSETADTVLLDSIQYFVFPNFVPWGGLGDANVYRFRPNGSDPNTAIMDWYWLRPYTGERPAFAEDRRLGLSDSWTDDERVPPALAEIFDQDCTNMGSVMKGLRATRKPGVTLANYMESRIRHMNNLLDRYLQA